MERVKTALVCGALAAAIAALPTQDARWLGAAGLCLLGALALSLDLYAFFARVRGWRFAVAAVPLNLMYYALNGISVCAGWLLHHVVGEPRPDPVVEAYAEVGMLSDPPLPSRRRGGAWARAESSGTSEHVSAPSHIRA
jgi:hypothetical protein